MLAAAVTLGLFAFILTLVVDVMRRDGAKVIAALDGNSWTAGPSEGRPVTIRFNRPEMAAKSAPMISELRAAA